MTNPPAPPTASPAPAAPVREGGVPSERRRLGLSSARRFGIVFTLAALLNLVVPELPRIGSYLPAVAGLVIVVVGFALLGGRFPRTGAALVYGAGLLTLAVFLLPGFGQPSFASPFGGSGSIGSAMLGTITALSSWAIPSLLVALGAHRALPLIAVGAAVPVMAVSVVVTLPSGRAPFVALAIVGGWLALALAGVWLDRSAKRADAGLARLRRGYAEERRSTEAEAELRYGARVLHDTVLATLTVIAHSGDGVPPRVLSGQAASDSALLAQLRLSGTEGLRPATLPHESAASDAGLRAAVDDWCREHGLAVAWHGEEPSGAALSAAQLDALVRAVCECLENVRRHSGRRDAEITVSADAGSVRVVVTDTGVGFDPALVPRGRLGLGQSVEARIRAVGGSTRVFSSPGRGTTVLLEVPR